MNDDEEKEYICKLNTNCFIMDGFVLILSIAMLVFGILQIVLFFKVWGMTNDVKSLSKDVHVIMNAVNERNFKDFNLPKEAKVKGYNGTFELIGMMGEKVACRDKADPSTILHFPLSNLIFDKE